MISNTGADQLKSFVDRIERLEEDKAAVLADIKEVYGEAKDEGFTVKIVRRVVAERRKDAATRAEENDLFDTYWGAVNGELFGDLPAAPTPPTRASRKTGGKRPVALAAQDGEPTGEFGPDADEQAFG